MTSQINLTVTVKAPVKIVYEAFTHWQLLTEWFCDDAAIRGRAGGYFFAAWNRGYQASGTVREAEPNKKLVLSVRGSDETADGQIDLAFNEQNGSTTVTLKHDTASDTWKRIWERGLENLQSYLETGYDLRITRRPMIGINPVELEAEVVAKLGLPITQGIRLGGLVPNMSAEKSGLLINDVIVELDGKPVTDFASIGVAVGDHQAGDVVDVVYYRVAQKQHINLTFSPRPIDAIPATVAEFADSLETLHTELDAEMRKVFEGVSEAEATRRPEPTEWSAREAVMHVLALQRWFVVMIETRVSGQEYGFAAVNHLEMIGAGAANFKSTQAILDELKHTRDETIALVRALPADVAANRGVFAFIVQQLLSIRDHDREHFEQIRKAVEAARQPVAVSG
jgi:uncharacterized protein YndB with AHSA1/START domain